MDSIEELRYVLSYQSPQCHSSDDCQNNIRTPSALPNQRIGNISIEWVPASTVEFALPATPPRATLHYVL